ILIFDHAHRDGLEVHEERRAAQLTAAGAKTAGQAGFVAGRELTQLDPTGQRRGKIADEGSEVDPVRRGEVDGGVVAIVYVVDPADLHRQEGFAVPFADGEDGQPPA